MILIEFIRKHYNRILRPFICDRNGCSKKEVGFATNNELVRHKRTVHGDNLKTTFICTRGDCAKENPPKRWPRADNFRAHLKRVHKIEQVSVIDLQHYSTSSESVAEGGPFAALDDDTENENVGVEINEDKFGKSASSFWCGFCCCIVRVVSDTSDPQGVRFDHIDDHFMGRRDQPKRNISEWLYIENTPTEREVTIVKRGSSSQSNTTTRPLSPIKLYTLPPFCILHKKRTR